ncbi:helix-turn-helix transcriptional regulator [Streptomyces sp. FL07-04A]|uniref:helix-turn-helix domain-containing protein n=1 Tax=Streptomyces sp. FL07-04A TaxID=3028658 RepID=UPI0029B2C87A|nr:helix-turn-helix transcriptional regulator [Streptomyces sp. FL07-04A]MDX3579187.1 helix-turn-helix transcriptional regulator [Streptomyces sp. FL07-04A]
MPRELKFSETLGNLIDNGGYRRNRGKICETVGISSAALSQYLSGRTTPSFDTLVRLADFFNVSLDFLVFGQQRAANELDYGPLARYVDLSLSRVQHRAEQQAALVARVGGIIAEHIDRAVTQAVENGARGSAPGMITDDETLIIEEYSEETLLISMNLQYDLIDLPGDGAEAAGRFFPVVARNVAAGRTYQFLLPGATGRDWRPLVSKFRSLLSEHTSGEQATTNCQFAVSSAPLFAGMGVYRLNVDLLRQEHPLLLEQLGRFLQQDGWMGYAIPPSSDFTADALFDEDHLKNARTQFATAWKSATRV